jgi:hypothetical protein
MRNINGKLVKVLVNGIPIITHEGKMQKEDIMEEFDIATKEELESLALLDSLYELLDGGKFFSMLDPKYLDELLGILQSKDKVIYIKRPRQTQKSMTLAYILGFKCGTSPIKVLLMTPNLQMSNNVSKYFGGTNLIAFSYSDGKYKYTNGSVVQLYKENASIGCYFDLLVIDEEQDITQDMREFISNSGEFKQVIMTTTEQENTWQ